MQKGCLRLVESYDEIVCKARFLQGVSQPRGFSEKSSLPASDLVLKMMDEAPNHKTVNNPKRRVRSKSNKDVLSEIKPDDTDSAVNISPFDLSKSTNHS